MKRASLPFLLLTLLTRIALGEICSPSTFIVAAAYPAPAPTQVVVADFNHDGFPDVVTVSGNSGTLSVLLNAGDGTFGETIVINIENTVSQVAAADLRGNGTVDLVVTIYSGIGVLLGNGDGTFAAPVYYQANDYYPGSLVVGKFDANDTLDVAITDGSGGNIDVFPGNGDGTFGTPLSTPASGAIYLVSGDFNGDSKLDLVSSNVSTGTISLYPGLGNGTFGAPATFVAGPQLSAIAAGDLDDDGKLDVVVTSGSFVSVLLGNGNGTFQAALLYPAGPSPGWVAVADFNADGMPDVAVTDFYNDTVSVLVGIGGGALGAPAPYLVANQTSGLAVADLDGDALPDVVAGDPKDGAVLVLRNAGAGDLLAVPLSNLPTGPSASGSQLTVAAADWNGDGRLDLAWGDGVGIDVIQSLGQGRFAQTQSLQPPPGVPGLGTPVAADFDGDGKPDLVSDSYEGLLLFHGLGNGSFGDPALVYASGNLGAIAAADFTGDGKADIVFVPTCCVPATIQVLPGNGDGTFQPPLQTPAGVDYVFYILPIDVDGDGKMDLVTTSENSVYVFLGNGDGTFQPPMTVTSNGSCCSTFWIAAGAFSGGAVDILVSQGSSSVALFPGHGDGTFGAPIQIALASNSGPVATGDFDGDGNLDFAVVSGSQNVLVFPGLGNRRFQTPATYPTNYPTALVSGDFAGGGTPDVASIAYQTISTLVNARLGVTVPLPTPVIVGSTATLNASASGYGPVQYQWRLEGAPLADGGRYSGTSTSQLTVADAAFSDMNAHYDVVVTDSCTTATSAPQVGLQVEFADVPPSNLFYADVNTVAAHGITAGCTTVDYCPDTPTTRAQMAVFLLRAQHGSGYVPPHCSGLFTDVPCPSAYADWIEQLAAEQVTAGCGGGQYCPDASVTRSQMAVFLLKTSQGPAYEPPQAVGIFGDVPPGSFAADWIEAIYHAHITGGCSVSPLLYCPGSSVSRGQMAAFLVNTFYP